MEDWPALLRWTDPAYLVSLAGPRTVPVEVGGAPRRLRPCLGGGAAHAGGQAAGLETLQAADAPTPGTCVFLSAARVQPKGLTPLLP
jgi:hypothetical protein